MSEKSTLAKLNGRVESRPMVKAVGCAACWASHNVLFTRACWIIPPTALSAAM